MKPTYTRTKEAIPNHWNISYLHQKDIADYIAKKFNDIDKVSICENINKIDLNEIFVFYVNMLSSISDDDFIFLFQFCFYKSFCVYIDAASQDTTDSCKNATIADLINEIIIFTGKDIENVVYDYETIEKKFNDSKEKEKLKILERLQNMKDEQREVDNLKKYSKLGEEWGKGLQKKLRLYDQDEYNKERDGDVEETRELTNDEQAEIDEIEMDDDGELIN